MAIPKTKVTYTTQVCIIRAARTNYTQEFSIHTLPAQVLPPPPDMTSRKPHPAASNESTATSISDSNLSPEYLKPMSEEGETLTREELESKMEREAIAKQKAAEEAERVKVAQESHKKERGRTG
ncbi:hypothetical protein MMC27_002488 [Xylographa pallens]|nr:hypothetical protein [Xylographa pallens]